MALVHCPRAPRGVPMQGRLPWMHRSVRGSSFIEYSSFLKPQTGTVYETGPHSSLTVGTSSVTVLQVFPGGTGVVGFSTGGGGEAQPAKNNMAIMPINMMNRIASNDLSIFKKVSEVDFT